MVTVVKHASRIYNTKSSYKQGMIYQKFRFFFSWKKKTNTNSILGIFGTLHCHTLLPFIYVEKNAINQFMSYNIHKIETCSHLTTWSYFDATL